MIIAVTGLNTAAEPEAGFGVLQSLQGMRNRDCRLIGFAYKELETGLFHPGLMDRAFIVPLPRSNSGAFLHRIRQIKMEAGLDIIIPTIGEEIDVFADMENEFREMGVKTLLPDRQGLREMQLKVDKKLKTTKKAPAEDEGAYTVIPSSLTKNPVAERVVPAGRVNPDLFAVALIADRKSKIVALAAVKKILISRYGGTWMALTVECSEFRGLAEKLIRNTAWRGPLTVEIIEDGKGKPSITGIRPVFPDWISLAGAAGANLPVILIDILQGKDFKGVVQTAPGKVLVRAALDVVTNLNQFGDISLSGEFNYDHK